MAFRRSLAQKLFNLPKTASTPAIANCRISSPSWIRALISLDSDVFMHREMRTLQKRSIFRPASSSDSAPVLFGDKISEKIKALDLMQNRLNLDGLKPPADKSSGVTLEVAKKALQLCMQEKITSKLREIRADAITHEEFVQICVKSCRSRDVGLEFAKKLDESGTVIVFGNVVILRTEKLVEAVEGVISTTEVSSEFPTKEMIEAEKEMEEMEKRKTLIDSKAEKLVRRELGLGLCFGVIQTLGLMRLTFWELSWDVMEPICFYLASFYFLAGYAFFLRTLREPSFEGFFQHRVSSKRKKLMKAHGFDIQRYQELLRGLSPGCSRLSPRSAVP